MKCADQEKILEVRAVVMMLTSVKVKVMVVMFSVSLVMAGAGVVWALVRGLVSTCEQEMVTALG